MSREREGKDVFFQVFLLLLLLLLFPFQVNFLFRVNQLLFTFYRYLPPLAPGIELIIEMIY